MPSFFKIIEDFTNFTNKTTRKVIFFSLILILLFAILAIFDKGLAVGLLLFYFLSAVLLMILSKFGLANKYIFFIFLIVFLSHFSVVLFLYLTQFPALGGGADFDGYHQGAVEIANRFNLGNFSVQGIPLLHYFPVLIGAVYALTLPQMIVGQMFVVWTACVAAVLLNFLASEIGASKKSSFAVAAIASFYPSSLYFGSLLLKDTVIVPLVLICLLITVKILKKFTKTKFLLFFITLTGLMHLRFYIGFAMMFAFVISWFLLSEKTLKERISTGMMMVLILGFIPQILGFGYYGADSLAKFLDKDVITTYREIVYAPPNEMISVPVAMEKNNTTKEIIATRESGTLKENNISNGNAVKEVGLLDAKPANFKENPELLLPKNTYSGSGSSFRVEAGFDSPIKFAKNYFLSFVYSAFGPFPWQLRYKRHAFFLLETIPLYCFLIIILVASVKKIKIEGIKIFFRTQKFAIPILIFSVISLGALSLYINNFGIIARVRMPIFISLLAIFALSLRVENIKIKIPTNYKLP